MLGSFGKKNAHAILNDALDNKYVYLIFL